MSDVAQLPPLFRRLQTLDKDLHGELRLRPSTGFGFARGVNAIPLAVGELAAAAAHFPIVFTGGEQPVPVAVVGYRNAENLFLEPDGNWAAGRYVPAYLRAYPFLLAVTGPESADLAVLMDPEAETLSSTEGELLLQNGAPSPVLQDRLRLCQDLRLSLMEAGRFAAALKSLGGLQDQQALLEFHSGEKAKLDGFQSLDAACLQRLPDATVLEWHRNGWLAAAHAVLFSSSQWAALMARAGRPAEAQAT